MPILQYNIQQSAKGITLKLSSRNLRADDMPDMCSFLNMHPEIVSLDVSYNHIGDAGAKALAGNTSLTSLDVYFNDIGPAGAKALAGNTSLTSLDMRSNHLGDDGAKALTSNTSLTSLNVASNKIGPAGAKALAGNTRLTSLDVSCNDIGPAGAKALAGNTSLTSLNVRSNNIGDDGAKALAGNTILTSLHVAGNNIGDVGAKALAGNTILTSLDVALNNIGPDGAKALAGNTRLTSLDVGSNGIGPAGAQALAGNTSLTSLNVCYNNIGPAGAKALAGNTSLTSLNVTGNNIGDAAIFAQALNSNYTLQELIGLDHASITSILTRNKKLASECLNPLTEAIQKSHLLTDIAVIESCLKQLSVVVPDLDELDEESYPWQAKRLLTGLAQVASFNELSLEDALYNLLFAFKHPPFQQYADKTLALLLAGDFAATLKEKDMEQQGLLLQLYGFRHHLHAPEIKPFVLIALFKLANPDKPLFTMDERTDFERCAVILTEREFLTRIQNALALLQTTQPEAFETRLLQRIGQSNRIDSSSLPAACLSPTFLNALKAQYPDANVVTILEHCLFTASSKATSFFMDIHKAAGIITEKTLTDYALQQEQNTSPALADITGNLKRALQETFFPQPNPTQEGMQPLPPVASANPARFFQNNQPTTTDQKSAQAGFMYT